MLFLDLYGIPGAQSDASRSHVPQALRPLAERISGWKRTSSNRRFFSRMTISQLEGLQLGWPEDIRNIKAHS